MEVYKIMIGTDGIDSQDLFPITTQNDRLPLSQSYRISILKLVRSVSVPKQEMIQGSMHKQV